jgi:hypothetical protein
MFKIITSLVLCLVSVFCHGQKVKKYGEVDSVIQYQDAQIVSYKKSGRQIRDTIWNNSKKDIEIDWAHVVQQRSDYLRPRFRQKQ